MGEMSNPTKMKFCLKSEALHFIAILELELESEDDLTEEMLKEYFVESIVKCKDNFIPDLKKIFNGLRLKE